MKVKNVNSTGYNYPKPSCKCDTWLEHWMINRKIRPAYCRCCSNKFNTSDLVGGHVKKVDGYDNDLYIVPLCSSCNSSFNDKPFDVFEDDLIPANGNKCINK